jgi:hypothetical protein
MIYKNMKDKETSNNNMINSLGNLNGNKEYFENGNNNNNNNTGKTKEQLQEENSELQKYLKIHGLYPESQGIDMSKYVLKTAVKPGNVCPDMSKYITKTSVPPPVKCPTINRDEWLRKTELPANWNKECPAHPDLTNYVLKSTVPPKQECPSCICPKIKVNAGLCREPTKEECLQKTNILKEACPKPEPCPEPKCPPQEPCPEPDPAIWIKRSELPPNWNKDCPPREECAPCPRPPPPPKCPEPVCPACPQQKSGACPQPERCPPAQDCPKCYDVKYLKVPVVKSEPLPRPNKETIFPTNLIETKLVRQQQPTPPRQPRVLSLRNNNNGDNDDANNNRLETMVSENNLAPSDMALNNNRVNMAPVSSNNQRPTSLFNKAVESIKGLGQNNRNHPKEHKGQCNKGALNNAFNKFGESGFNNQL